jgi:hypothetical protein
LQYTSRRATANSFYRFSMGYQISLKRFSVDRALQDICADKNHSLDIVIL